MDNKSYVITGSSSYLGKALANFYCRKGNKVVLTSRRICKDLNKYQSKDILYLPSLNLVDDNDLCTLYKEIDTFFRTDSFHVINCVGFFPDYKLIEEITMEEAKKVLDSNVLAVFGVANKLIPLMCMRGGGHFIGFSMHTLYQNYPYMAIFSAAKMALEGLIKGISNEYLKYNIHANVISLATLLTETEKRIKPKGDHDHWLKPEEICEIVNNLIKGSNGLVNGSVIHAYKYSKTFFEEAYINRISK